MADWDPSLYLRFGAERTRPAIDLANRVELSAPRRIVDLGCGPGNSTAVVRARWPDADLEGLDNDPAMLDAARASGVAARWTLADAGSWAPVAEFDLVFSNAMLQWLPDHPTTIRRWFAAVRSGGALAVQTPNHARSALHRHMLELADRPEWKDATAGARGAIVTNDPSCHYDTLAPLAKRIEIWETEYCHVLAGPEAILDWIRGTGLRPFLAALPNEKERGRFEAMLLERVTESYPRRVDGRVVFPFRRLFFVAYVD